MTTKEIKIEIVVEERDESDVIDSLVNWYYGHKIGMTKLIINGKRAKLPVGSTVDYRSNDYVGV